MINYTMLIHFCHVLDFISLAKRPFSFVSFVRRSWLLCLCTVSKNISYHCVYFHLWFCKILVFSVMTPSFKTYHLFFKVHLIDQSETHNRVYIETNQVHHAVLKKIICQVDCWDRNSWAKQQILERGIKNN